MTFGEYSDLQAVVKSAEVLDPEYPTKPRAIYVQLAKRFIAGAISPHCLWYSSCTSRRVIPEGVITVLQRSSR
jgi:hypothetical protein